MRGTVVDQHSGYRISSEMNSHTTTWSRISHVAACFLVALFTFRVQSVDSRSLTLFADDYFEIITVCLFVCLTVMLEYKIN